MTDKELKHLRRAELIEIIYRYQQKEQKLQKQIADLNAEIEARRIRIENTGSIADAAIAVNNVMEAAQAAADQYLCEIKAMNAESETRANKIIAEANRRADRIVQQAQDKAASIRMETDQYCLNMRKETKEDCAELKEKVRQLMKNHSELKGLLDFQ